MRTFLYQFVRLVFVGAVSIFCVRVLQQLTPAGFDNSVLNLQSTLPFAWAIVLIVVSLVVDALVRAVEEHVAQKAASPASQLIVSALTAVVTGCVMLAIEYHSGLFQARPDPSPDPMIEHEIRRLYEIAHEVPVAATGQIEDAPGTYGKLPLDGPSLTNFIADSHFVVPGSAQWSYGYQFRANERSAYVICLSAWNTWYLYGIAPDGSGARRLHPLDHGPLDSLNLSRGSTNRLRLIVNVNQAFLYVNGAYIATVDLSQHIEAGDFALVSGVFAATSPLDEPLRYDQFSLRALPPE